MKTNKTKQNKIKKKNTFLSLFALLICISLFPFFDVAFLVLVTVINICSAYTTPLHSLVTPSPNDHGWMVGWLCRQNKNKEIYITRIRGRE